MAAAPAYLRLRRPALIDLGATDAKLYFDRQLTDLKDDRRQFEGEWSDIGRLISPRKVRMPGDTGAAAQSTNAIINNKATMASRIFRSGLYSGMSSPSRPWLRITTPDRDLAEFPKVKQALAQRSDKVALVFQQSNFYASIRQGYRGLGDFGNSCELIEDDFENVVRFEQYTLGSFYYGVGLGGKVNRVYREIPMRVADMVDKFQGNVSDAVMNEFDRGNYNTRVNVVHAIEPNRRIIQGARGLPGRPFIEVYYDPADRDQNGPSQGMMSISGYKLWPLMAGRWEVLYDETYGHGCGFETIGDVKALQAIEFRKGQLISKLAVPPTRSPSSNKKAVIDHSPGGVSYYDPLQGPEGRPEALYLVNPAGLAGITNEIAAHEGRIDTAYYVDIFMMLMRMEGVQPRNELEISERNGERFVQLGPALDNLASEKLNVAVQRTYQRCEEAGLFAPLPPEVAGQPLRIEYTSILAQAQKAAGISGIERVAGYVGNLAGAYPEARHKFDAAQSIDEYADMIGVRPSIIRSDEDYQKLVDAEAAQKNAAAATQMAVHAADAAKTLSQTDTSRPNALTQIAGGFSG